MKIPAFNENASFIILDKSGKEIPFEELNKEAFDFWQKVYGSEQTVTGACPFKSYLSSYNSWPKVFHSAFLKKEIGNISWDNVKLSVTNSLTMQAGYQLLSFRTFSPMMRHNKLRDYYEIIGAYHKLIEFWEKEKGYELVSVSNGNGVTK